MTLLDQLKSLEITSDPLFGPPRGIVAGQTGVGKTMEVALSAPDLTWFVTDDNGLRSYAKTVNAVEQIHKGETPVDVNGNPISIPDYFTSFEVVSRAEYMQGKPGLVHPREFKRYAMFDPHKWDPKRGAYAPEMDHYDLLMMMMRLLEHPKLKGLVIDEMSTFLERLDRDVDKPIGGKVTQDGRTVPRYGSNRYGKFPFMTRAIVSLVNQAKRYNKALIMLCHWREVKFVEADPDPKKADPVDLGKQKYPSGPAFPSGPMISSVVKELDFCWQLVADADEELDDTSNSERFYLTEPTKSAIRKTRDGTTKQSNRLPVGLRANLESIGFQFNG